ncbi:MAG: hypothetical protein RLZZ303_1304 [Candidatus Hydrogenedentota bacterium]|jgi:sugar lactone lactonase YvrE
MKKILYTTLIGLLALAAYLLFWPVPIDPASWTPPASTGLTGEFAVNTLLAATERLAEGSGPAPEDVAIDAAGRLYVGFENGQVARIAPDGSGMEPLAHTGGRPLGLHFDKQGHLVIADTKKGLLSLDPENGTLLALSSAYRDVPFGFTDDVDIDDNGVMYFSDASYKFDHTAYTLDLLEHRPNGALYSYDPRDKTTRLLVDELYFANGVAVDHRQEFVLVVETGKYRILRHWIRGEKAGQTEKFIDNLPGFPDGVSAGSGGVFWVAIATPRDATLDALLPHPFIRKVIARLPRILQPAPKRHSFVLGLDRDGKVVHNLQDPAGRYAPITSVQEHGGFLYFGSIIEHAIGRFPRPAGLDAPPADVAADAS